MGNRFQLHKGISFILSKWQYLLLLAVTFFLYQHVISYGFVNFDDHLQVYDNIRIQHISLPQVKVLFTTATVGMYQPLTSLAFSVIYGFFSLNAGYYHLFSVILHFLNACLVFNLLNTIIKSKNSALILSLLFLTHPLTVESVMWVSATSTILYAFFFLAAAKVYISFIEKQKNSYYFLALVLFILGVLAKVQMITFLCFIFLIHWFYKKLSLSNMLRMVPFIVIAVFFVIVAFHFRKSAPVSPEYSAILLTPVQVMWYLFKFFAPFSLSVLYDWPLSFGAKEYVLAFSIFILPLLLYFFRKNKLFLFGVFFYISTLAIHTSLFSQFMAPYADRYAYIPLIGILISLFACSSYLKKNIVLVVSGAYILFFSFMTIQQKEVWKNSETLWANTIQSQETAIAYVNRASHYIDVKNYEKALPDIEYLLTSDSRRIEVENKSSAYYFLGLIHYDKRDLKKAEKSYINAIEQDPDNYSAYYNLGNLYTDLQQYPDAIDSYTKGIQLEKKPKNFSSFFKNRGNAYYQLKQYDKALADVNKAIEIYQSSPLKTMDVSLYDFKAHLLEKLK